jgi:hypothetical protein
VAVVVAVAAIGSKEVTLEAGDADDKAAALSIEEEEEEAVERRRSEDEVEDLDAGVGDDGGGSGRLW